MNGFVDYLNSMNNANSDTAEALAESQVLSAYYEKIQIQRKLGSYIANRIRNQENITVYCFLRSVGAQAQAESRLRMVLERIAFG